MLTAPAPFEEAIKYRKLQKILPTTAGSYELSQLPPEIRERALFSARTSSAAYLAKMQALLTEATSYAARAARGETAMDAATIRIELRKQLEAEGYIPPKGKRGTLQDLSSDRRLNLIIDTQMKQNQGWAQHQVQNDPDILDAFPCLELVRIGARKVPRVWSERWVRAGGKLYGGRMIARKDAPIWASISRFGNPYPPFDFNSGMGVREIDRPTAESLGAIKRSTIVQPTETPLNNEVVASLPPDISPELKTAIEDSFMGSVQFRSNGLGMRILPDAWDLRGLLPMKEMPAQSVAAKSIAVNEFNERMVQGEVIASALDDMPVTFGKRIPKHWNEVNKGEADFARRAKELDNAIETIRHPLEIWERGDRLLYIGKFSRENKKDLILQVVTTLEGEVDSYHVNTNQPNSTNKNRSGKLRFYGGSQ